MGLHWGRCGVWGCRNNHVGTVRKVFRCLQGVRFWECVECGELFCSEHAGRDPRVPRRHAQRNYRFLCCPKCGGEKRTQKPSFGSPGSGV